jgi:hypothetical protein
MKDIPKKSCVMMVENHGDIDTIREFTPNWLKEKDLIILYDMIKCFRLDESVGCISLWKSCEGNKIGMHTFPISKGKVQQVYQKDS